MENDNDENLSFDNNDGHNDYDANRDDRDDYSDDDNDSNIILNSQSNLSTGTTRSNQSQIASLKQSDTNTSLSSFPLFEDNPPYPSHHHIDVKAEEEELQSLAKLAESLAPRVTSLLNSNEKVLNNLLLIEEEEGLDKNIEEEEEDGMEDEWNGLANAENMLRDELGMISMGFDFMVTSDHEDDEEDDDDYYYYDNDDHVNGDDELNDIHDISNKGEDYHEQTGKSDIDMEQTHDIQEPELYDDDDNGDDENVPTTTDAAVVILPSETILPPDLAIRSKRSLLDDMNSLDSNKTDDDDDESDEDSTASVDPVDKSASILHDTNQIIKENTSMIEESKEEDVKDEKPHDNKMITTTTSSSSKSTKLKTTSNTIKSPTKSPSKTPTKSPTKQVYTLYDHAKFLSLHFHNHDLGYPSCPLLTQGDAENLLDMPSFRHEMLQQQQLQQKIEKKKTKKKKINNHNSDTSGSSGSSIVSATDYDDDDDDDDDDDLQRVTQFKDKKSRQEAIQEIMQCTREYVKPMSRAALSRIYEGLVDKIQSDINKRRKRRKAHNNNGGDASFNSNNNADDDHDDVGIKIQFANEQELHRNGNTQVSEILPVRTVAVQIRPDVLCGAVMDAVHTAVNSLRGEVTKRQGNHLRALVPGCWVPESHYMSFRPANGDDIQTFPQLLASPMMSPLHKAMNGMAFLPPFVVDAQLCTRKRSRDGERIFLLRFYRIEENQIVDGNALCPPSLPHAANKNFNSELIPDLNECNTLLRESSALFQKMRLVATTGGNIGFDASGEDRNETDGNDVGSNGRSDATTRKGSGTPNRKNSYVRRMLTSPLKLFSPSKEKVTRSPRRKSQSLSIRFKDGNSVLQGEKAAQKFASNVLLNSFIATPSVQDGQSDADTLPSLSVDDWPFVQSSWRFITLCLNELDNRDMNYSSLVSCPFGAFPSLPTLDVQLCSQIKALCKDNMIVSLLKGAQELEEFARESEYSCAKIIQVLQPSFLSYQLESPTPPEAIPLASYPLDFTPPEVSCPPWGQKVVEALNLIAAKSPSSNSGFLNDLEFNATTVNEIKKSTNTLEPHEHSTHKSEFQKARDATAMVLAAFMKQEDEELSARLGRKNLQVMDRLAKMQAYKRDLIITIRDAYGMNLNTTMNANRFHGHAQQYLKSLSNDDSTPSAGDENFFPASDQVPLIHCRAICGKVPSTCYVTCYQILLVTHPLLGESHTYMEKLSDIYTEVNTPTSKSILNPMPSVVTVCSNLDKKELFIFKPTIGAQSFTDFISILKEVSNQTVEALKFSSRLGLRYMLDEKESVEKAALGVEQIDLGKSSEPFEC